MSENSGFSTKFRKRGFPVFIYNYSATQIAETTAKFFAGIALGKTC